MAASEVRIEPIPRSQKPVVRNLFELYRHDLSEWTGDDLTEHGLHDYAYFDHYWTEDDRHQFFITLGERPVGFAFVNWHTLPENDGAHAVAELFVLRKYRGRAVGAVAAEQVLKRFPGPWEVRVLERNQPALRFWRRSLARITAGRFREWTPRPEDWAGQVFSFTI